MEKIKERFNKIGENSENVICNRTPVILGILLTAVFTGIFIYATAAYCLNLNREPVSAYAPLSRYGQQRQQLKVHLCVTESKPNSIWRRSKRAADVPALIKRVARPLSVAPPIPGLNGTYDPPLYHDVGAKCAWGHLSGRRVPNIEEAGVSYDSQQLGARTCDDPEICKSVCLRMHKPDDPYLCNYFTWNREKKVALFFFLEPTIRWNLTQDVRVETYFWQCKETPCTWYWRPHRIHRSFAEMATTQLRSAHGIIAVNQCTDFATCQFACETRPSFRELQEQGQALESNQTLDDPTCDYIVMPSTDTKTQFSFLFSMRQPILKNTTYARSLTYDSFELICKNSPPPSSLPSSHQSTVVIAPAPGQIRQTRKREILKKKSDGVFQSQTLELRDCKRGNDRIECSSLVSDVTLDAPCVHLDLDKMQDHVSISIDSKRPVWFSVEQAGVDGMEEHVPLAPGRQHVIDLRPDARPGSEEPSKCGPLAAHGRRCAATCNDRLAIDACGCSINTDPSMGYMESLVSVPICSDQQLKSCVLGQLRSNAFFDCMNECKKECSAWRPFEILNALGSKLQADDYLTLDLFFRKPGSGIKAEPLWSEKNVEQVMEIWAPVLMVILLCLALTAVVCLSRRR